jgi:hypothetical protein
MIERRYNDDEVAAIFAQAAQGQPTPGTGASGDDGLTLPELQQIGREVGIAPDAVARAAHSLALREQGHPGRFLGFPISVQRTVALHRRLTEQEWEQLVVQLRQVFNAAGTLRSDGAFREWRNGNLRVLLEPTPAGHQLRLRSLNGGAREWMRGGLVALGASAATAIALAAGGHLSRGAPGVLLLSLLGLGMFANGALRLPSWARRRQRQMEDIGAALAVPSGSTRADLPDPPAAPDRH